MKYRGITYFPIFDDEFIQWLWKLVCCPREWHLFDEVEGEEHYLYCDACGLYVYIDRFEEEQCLD